MVQQVDLGDEAVAPESLPSERRHPVDLPADAKLQPLPEIFLFRLKGHASLSTRPAVAEPTECDDRFSISVADGFASKRAMVSGRGANAPLQHDQEKLLKFP